MTSWQMPGMPDPMRLLQKQAEVLAQLPETLLELQRAVRGLADAVEATRQTAVAAQQVTARIERILDEIEDPVRGLRPGIERLAAVLEDPAVTRIPTSLESIESAVLPIAAGITRTRTRLARARAWPSSTGAQLRERFRPRTR